jgi:predicted DNA binding CopG/RHH family protein
MTYFPKLEPIGQKEQIKENIYKENIPFKYLGTLAESEQLKTYTIEDLNKLESYFKSIALPNEIQLKQGERITNVNLFILSHLKRCKEQIRAASGLPFYERLNQLKNILESKNLSIKVA